MALSTYFFSSLCLLISQSSWHFLSTCLSPSYSGDAVEAYPLLQGLFIPLFLATFLSIHSCHLHPAERRDPLGNDFLPLRCIDHQALIRFHRFPLTYTACLVDLSLTVKAYSSLDCNRYFSSSCVPPIDSFSLTEGCGQDSTISLFTDMHFLAASSQYTKPNRRMLKIHSTSLFTPLKPYFLSSSASYSSISFTSSISDFSSLHPTATTSPHTPSTSPHTPSTSPHTPSTSLHPTAPLFPPSPHIISSDLPASSSSRLPSTEPLLPPALRRFTPQIPGQVLYPATPEDIQILSQSTHKYPLPLSVEGGVIVRLVRLSEAVTSPVSRCVRNRQFGIRGTSERWQLLAFGLVCTSGLSLLGFWQIKRMKWKVSLVEHRRSQLAFPRVTVAPRTFEEALPWNPLGSSTIPACTPVAPPPPPPPTVLSLLYPFSSPITTPSQPLEGWAYRSVELKGVLDTSYTLPVGPRTGAMSGRPGYLLISPLRLEDGRSVLVNRGHCPVENLSAVLENSTPAWVIVRAVVDPGELLTPFLKKIKMKGKPNEGQYVSLEPESLGEHVGAVNVQECQLCILSSYDILYLDDIVASSDTVPATAISSKILSRFLSTEKHSVQKPLNTSLEMKQKKDYLCFWADEYTHFNYACQWFMMAAAVFGMTLYKLIEVTRWRF
ncbi:hypothetical protein IE077_004573 [Cardiosporidium cionae]|uniref:SURF1-like protein n=1 Tax=Cardiosporidium cionae TaxID=476202 RepID=A0ABQ7JER0_9APIC|nr:hypothetical protein IE077_004573 [Cardiosporidium cionae]|eukprot:KAF8822461.1 hypothetical protein IE077_004573 [Cardiosporidium cionae]